MNYETKPTFLELHCKTPCVVVTRVSNDYYRVIALDGTTRDIVRDDCIHSLSDAISLSKKYRAHVIPVSIAVSWWRQGYKYLYLHGSATGDIEIRNRIQDMGDSATPSLRLLAEKVFVTFNENCL